MADVEPDTPGAAPAPPNITLVVSQDEANLLLSSLAYRVQSLIDKLQGQAQTQMQKQESKKPHAVK